jgi:hypothetical protein
MIRRVYDWFIRADGEDIALAAVATTAIITVSSGALRLIVFMWTGW